MTNTLNILLLRLDRLLETSELSVRRHVNEVLLGRSTIRPAYRVLERALGYGHWISPAGELIPVPTMGHAKKAEQLSLRTGITADDSLNSEDRWRIPYIREGWVRTVVRGDRLTVQGMYFPSRVIQVVRELVLHHDGEVLIENVKTSAVVMILKGSPRIEWERKLREFAAKSPKLPAMALRQAESLARPIGVSMEEAKVDQLPCHFAVYNGKVVRMDYVSDPKEQFKFAGMRIVDNGADGHVVTPDGKVFAVTRSKRRATPVQGEERDRVLAQAKAQV